MESEENSDHVSQQVLHDQSVELGESEVRSSGHLGSELEDLKSPVKKKSPPKSNVNCSVSRGTNLSFEV